MTKDEAMRMALEALEAERDNYQDWDEKDGAPEYIYEAITALREALAEQPAQQCVACEGKPSQENNPCAVCGKPAQQEPVAWMHPDGRIWTFGRGLDKSTFTVPLSTSPPQRIWVGLTDEERDAIFELHNTRLGGWDYSGDKVMYYGHFEDAVAAIEAKLKEKNA